MAIARISIVVAIDSLSCWSTRKTLMSMLPSLLTMQMLLKYQEHQMKCLLSMLMLRHSMSLLIRCCCCCCCWQMELDWTFSMIVVRVARVATRIVRTRWR